MVWNYYKETDLKWLNICVYKNYKSSIENFYVTNFVLYDNVCGSSNDRLIEQEFWSLEKCINSRLPYGYNWCIVFDSTTKKVILDRFGKLDNILLIEFKFTDFHKNGQHFGYLGDIGRYIPLFSWKNNPIKRCCIVKPFEDLIPGYNKLTKRCSEDVLIILDTGGVLKYRPVYKFMERVLSPVYLNSLIKPDLDILRSFLYDDETKEYLRNTFDKHNKCSGFVENIDVFFLTRYLLLWLDTNMIRYIQIRMRSCFVYQIMRLYRLMVDYGGDTFLKILRKRLELKDTATVKKITDKIYEVINAYKVEKDVDKSYNLLDSAFHMCRNLFTDYKYYNKYNTGPGFLDEYELLHMYPYTYGTIKHFNKYVANQKIAITTSNDYITYDE